MSDKSSDLCDGVTEMVRIGEDGSVDRLKPTELDPHAEVIKRLDRIIELLELRATEPEKPKRRFIGDPVT